MDKLKDKVLKAGGKSSPGNGSTGPQNLLLNTNKAGMEGLDTNKINEIIKNASMGSRFYEHKEKRQQQLDIKISEMKQEVAAFTEDQIKKATLQMDQLVKDLEMSRDLSQTIVHVDMDMYYAAVEMRDDPSLRDKPMAVGGMGMLSTSNYAARKFGVRAAMPGFIGKKLCPDLVIVPPDFTKYKEVSKDVQEIFSQYDANFCPMSLDEAYLNITEYMHKYAHHYGFDNLEDCGYRGLSEAIVAEMRQKICDKTQLTASAGIAPNTLLAKVCSDMNKPNGQFYLPPDRDQILTFISTLPIRKVSGIGDVMEQSLHALDITVCSHLMMKRGLLKLLFSDISYNNFMNIALGLGHTSLESWLEKDRKSISTESTFRDTANKVSLFRIVEELCNQLADDMKQKEILGKAFTLKLKTSDFQIKTRTQTLPDHTCASDVMVSCARRLLQHEMNASAQPLSLRLLGVRLSGLMSSSEVGPKRQITLTQMFSQSLKPKTSSVTANEMKKKMVGDTSTHTREIQLNMKDAHQPDITASGSTITSSTVQSTTSIMSNSKKTVNATKKSSVSIENFLSKSLVSLDTTKSEYHECPVCGNQIKVSDFTYFLVHVDRCHEANVDEPSAPTVPLDAKRDNDIQILRIISTSKEERDVEKVGTVSGEVHSMHTGPKSNGGATYNYGDDEHEEHSEFSHISEAVAPTREISKLMSGNQVHEFECPVCNQKQLNTLRAFNKHVDDCLSGNTINEIMQQDSIVSGPSSSTQSTSRSGFVQPNIATEGRKRKGNISEAGEKKMKLESNAFHKYFSS